MDELLSYVNTYFSHLMTAEEKLAQEHLTAIEPLYMHRVVAGESRREKASDRLRETLLGVHKRSDDPEVLFLARGGSHAFRERTAERILLEHRDQIFANTCPACNALPRTPRARQCRACGHDWH
jgi:hypothetical protein